MEAMATSGGLFGLKRRESASETRRGTAARRADWLESFTEPLCYIIEACPEAVSAGAEQAPLGA